MSEPVILDADQAAGMTRAQALATLVTAEDVPEKDRRIAQIMLDGPVIELAEENRLLGIRPKRPPLTVAVAMALHELSADARAERALDQAEFARFAR